MQNLLSNVSKIWDCYNFDANLAACELSSVIPQNVDVLVENLLLEAEEPIRFLRMKEALKPSCDHPDQLVMTDSKNKGLLTLREIFRLFEIYPYNIRNCKKVVWEVNGKKQPGVFMMSKGQWKDQPPMTSCEMQGSR